MFGFDDARHNGDHVAIIIIQKIIRDFWSFESFYNYIGTKPSVCLIHLLYFLKFKAINQLILSNEYIELKYNLSE